MKFTFIVAIIFIPLNSWADLSECDGVWTNKSCSVEKKEVVPEVQTADSVKLKNQGQKKSLFHVLNMKNIKASSEYGIKFDLSQAEEACTDPDSSIDNCRLKIKESDAILDEKLKVAAELKTKEKALKLQEEANRIQEQRNKIEEKKPGVVVIQKRNIIIPRDYLRPKDKGVSIKIESKGDSTKVEWQTKTHSKKHSEKDMEEEVKSRHKAATVK